MTIEFDPSVPEWQRTHIERLLDVFLRGRPTAVPAAVRVSRETLTSFRVEVDGVASPELALLLGGASRYARY